MNVVFVISRSASGRPTAMHELQYGTASATICGTSMEGWSRYFVPESVARGALKGMLCGNCARHTGRKS